MISVSSTAVGGSGVVPPTSSAAPNNGTAGGANTPSAGVVAAPASLGTTYGSNASSGTDGNTSAATATDTTIAGQIAKAAHAQSSANATPATDAQLEDLQSKMAKLNPELTFVLEKGSSRAVIQLMDRTTKEVIQQFPSEAAMQISKELERYANGKLVNKVA